MRSASTVNGSEGPTAKMNSPRSPSKDQVTASGSSPGNDMVAVSSARISMTMLPGSSGGPQFQVPTIEAAPPGVGEAACWVPGVHATPLNASAVRPTAEFSSSVPSPIPSGPPSNLGDDYKPPAPVSPRRSRLQHQTEGGLISTHLDESSTRQGSTCGSYAPCPAAYRCLAGDSRHGAAQLITPM